MRSLRLGWDALRNLRGWPLAWLVFCVAQLVFQLGKLVTGRTHRTDVILSVLFLTAGAFLVAQAVHDERKRRYALADRPTPAP